MVMADQQWWLSIGAVLDLRLVGFTDRFSASFQYDHSFGPRTISIDDELGRRLLAADAALALAREALNGCDKLLAHHYVATIKQRKEARTALAAIDAARKGTT